MSVTHATRRPGRSLVNLAAAIISLALIVGVPIVDSRSASIRAAGASPLAVIVVGPSGDRTAQYRLEAAQIAEQLQAYGARVQQVSSPSATWSAVRAASRGANLFVYLGQGRGYPSPYGRLDTRRMNGLGLNRTAGDGNRNVGWYGEYSVRTGLGLARGAIVILKRVPYAAGSSEPGRAYPSARVAIQRADNYAAGFLAGGASAVFSSDRSVGTIVRDLFKSGMTLRSIFWNSPSTSTRYDSAFSSRRTSGATGIVAPYGPGRYFQAVVGRVNRTAIDWRRTWDPTLPAPAPAPTTGESVKVSSIPSLLSALTNNSITDIVVADGTYQISSAGAKRSNSLWIGSRFASRTRPVTVRAETTGGVIFDGGGNTSFGGLTFAEGAHHQTWKGFTFANGTPSNTGVVVFGGYAGRAAPHHITLRSITIPASVVSSDPGLNDHAVYVSSAVDGPHDLVLDGLTVDGRGGLDSALHFYHSDAANQNAWNVTVRRLRVTGTWQAIILWDRTLHNILFDDARITNATNVAIAYESPGATGIKFSDVISTGSGAGTGFYSSLGASPSGVTFLNSSLD